MRLNITAAYVDACVKRDARVHRIATCAIFHRFRFVLFREKLSFFFFSIFFLFFSFFFFFCSCEFSIDRRLRSSSIIVGYTWHSGLCKKRFTKSIIYRSIRLVFKRR